LARDSSGIEAALVSTAQCPFASPSKTPLEQSGCVMEVARSDD